MTQQLDALAAHIKALPDNRRQMIEAMLKKDVYTVHEIASLMSVHPETIRRAIRDKRLKAFKIGGSRAPWRVSAEEIERFMKERPPD